MDKLRDYYATRDKDPEWWPDDDGSKKSPNAKVDIMGAPVTGSSIVPYVRYNANGNPVDTIYPYPWAPNVNKGPGDSVIVPAEPKPKPNNLRPPRFY